MLVSSSFLTGSPTAQHTPRTVHPYFIPTNSAIFPSAPWEQPSALATLVTSCSLSVSWHCLPPGFPHTSHLLQMCFLSFPYQSFKGASKHLHLQLSLTSLHCVILLSKLLSWLFPYKQTGNWLWTALWKHLMWQTFSKIFYFYVTFHVNLCVCVSSTEYLWKSWAKQMLIEGVADWLSYWSLQH